MKAWIKYFPCSSKYRSNKWFAESPTGKTAASFESVCQKRFEIHRSMAVWRQYLLQWHFHMPRGPPAFLFFPHNQSKFPAGRPARDCKYAKDHIFPLLKQKETPPVSDRLPYRGLPSTLRLGRRQHPNTKAGQTQADQDLQFRRTLDIPLLLVQNRSHYRQRGGGEFVHFTVLLSPSGQFFKITFRRFWIFENSRALWS